MLSSPGIGSGLDMIDIVSQLIAVEKNPSSLASHKARQQAQLSVFSSLKGGAFYPASQRPRH